MIHKVSVSEFNDVLCFLQEYNDEYKETFTSEKCSLKNHCYLKSYFNFFKLGESIWGEEDFGYVFTFGFFNKSAEKFVKVLLRECNQSKLNFVFNKLLENNNCDRFYININKKNYLLSNLLLKSRCCIVSKTNTHTLFSRR